MLLVKYVIAGVLDSAERGWRLGKIDVYGSCSVQWDCIIIIRNPIIYFIIIMLGVGTPRL